MDKHQNALVIGKFYPPHYGHLHLIKTAAQNAYTVTVLVMGSKYDSLSLNDRAALIDTHLHSQGVGNVEVHTLVCEIPMNVDSEATWKAQEQAICSAIDGEDYDTLFSSEWYGDRLATDLGLAHVLVDLDRVAVPISGTALRKNPIGKWGFLPYEVRRHLTVKAVFVGAESTGTTTTSTRVWQHYHNRGGIWGRGQWIPEYGREYTIDMLEAAQKADPSATMDDLEWTIDDFLRIAREQVLSEDAALGQGSPLLVCDTDAHATRLWAQRYLDPYYTDYGNKVWHEASKARQADVVFVTDHVGVPFVQDGVRDGEHIREEMTEWFKNDADKRDNAPHVLLTGSIKERVDLATAVIDHLIDAKLTMRDPI